MQSGLSPLERAIQLTERVRTIHPRMEMQTLLMFLIIAQKKEVLKPQLETMMGMPSASAHRNIEKLVAEGLVNADKDFRRGTSVTLTAKGKRLAESLAEVIERTGEENGS